MAARLDVRDQGAARVLVIAHAARKNAVDAGLLARLAGEAARAAADGVRAIVLTGEGADFCSGYDLNAVEAFDPSDAGAELPDAPLGRACAALEAAEPPVIAAVEGAAMGAGFELLCACDFRFAAPGAKLSLPPARLGLIYAPDGIARVVRAVGLQNARQLLLRAPRLDAAAAAAMGLLELADKPLEAALRLADELAGLAPRSVSGMKRTLNALATHVPDELRAELDRERRAAFASEDAREGRAAFIEKRAPKWTGR